MMTLLYSIGVLVGIWILSGWIRNWILCGNPFDSESAFNNLRLLIEKTLNDDVQD